MKKKMVSFTVALALLFGTFTTLSNPQNVSAAEGMPQAQANGFIAPIERNIPSNAIIITTAAELAAIGGEHSVGKYFVLANDIYLTEEWKPINNFHGTLDGQGFTVNNVFVTEGAGAIRAGLFAQASANATIKNVGVRIGGMGITATFPLKYNPFVSGHLSRYVSSGGLIGTSEGATITNCFAVGMVANAIGTYDSSNHSGGLVGFAIGGRIINSYATGTIITRQSGGGLVGYCSGVSIANCYADNVVKSSTRYGDYILGGLVGYGESNTINNSYALGNISVEGNNAYGGGLIGQSSNTRITECYSSSIVATSSSSIAYTGGLIGYSENDTVVSSNKAGLTTAVINHEDTWYDYTAHSVAGGLLGYCKSSTLTNSYSTGTVSAVANIAGASSDSMSASGGLIGYCDGGIYNITNSYSSSPATAQCSITDRSYTGRIIGYNNGGSVTLTNSTHTSQNIVGDIVDKTGDPPIMSAWAVSGVMSAIHKGFVPEGIQSNYSNVITRLEFCRMAVKWLEHATGKGIDAILNEKGLMRDRTAFHDTEDPDILAAYALGITSGTGVNRFTPNGQFTREQAATMIMNTCRAVGVNISNPADSKFADLNTAASWAVNGINFVRANGIMSGTGNNLFSPKTIYTREQSIFTFNNINLLALPK